MIWPFKPRYRKQIARIEITGAIAGETRKRVLDALKTVEERKFPALLLRIDSPAALSAIPRKFTAHSSVCAKKSKLLPVSAIFQLLAEFTSAWEPSISLLIPVQLPAALA